MCDKSRSEGPCCQRSRALGRSTCQECGATLSPGREPTATERDDTAGEARLTRLTKVEVAHRENSQVDDCLISRIRSGVAVGGRFSWSDQVLTSTGLSSCALRNALVRLCRRGDLREDGTQRVRPGRFWLVFELLAGPSAQNGLAPPGGPAS